MHSNKCICICMCMHNNASTIEAALASIFAQKNTKNDLYIIISDDHSSDNSLELVKNIQLTHPNILLFQNDFGSASLNRNWLQNYVINELPNCILLGRLDADDTLAETDILQRIEQLFEVEKFYVLCMANNQIKNGIATGYINKPTTDLLNDQLLLDRLENMAQGIWEAELPSCNVFVQPQKAIAYKNFVSAEDHWNLVDYLLKKEQLKICIQPDWVYCNYHINGHLSILNDQSGHRRKSRKELYNYALQKIQELARNSNALELLMKYQPGNYQFLGAGFSGVVFHDDSWVYKVHIPLSTNNFNEVDNILYLKEKLTAFKNRKHFFPLKDLVKFEDYYILIYPYEKGENVTSLQADEMISFLAELWEMKLVCRSITKENNFIRVNNVVKLIDYEIEPYNDNLFLNLAARAFIQLDESQQDFINYNKLKRSTINQFQLPELKGFYPFLEKVFTTIAEKQFIHIEPTQAHLTQSSKISYDGIINPSVGLLIKACIQDSATLYNDVKFIIEQFPQIVAFKNSALLLDIYKQRDFLRQYSSNGKEEQLLKAANQLVDDGIIDQLIFAPHDISEIEKINYRYFGVESSETHTHDGVPLTAQLYAFEQIACDYIFQMDVDILIGKKSDTHDFLQKPIAALQTNEHAITCGFQIFHNTIENFQAFIGEDSTIAPDPRCCLIDRNKLIQLFPLSNLLLTNGWKYSWYRALQKHHQLNKSCSLRGGDTTTFYTHIQNYRKENRWVWWTIMEAFRNNLLPNKQDALPEVAGTIFDWTVPKRNESFVIVLILNESNIAHTQKTIQSIFSQDIQSFGLIIYNNTTDRKQTSLIQDLPSIQLNQITIIYAENKIASNEAIYKAIHYYLEDAQSYVCIIKQGDILIGNSVFSECINRLKLYNADVLIGKEISERTYTQSGMWASDFMYPRKYPETVLNGLFIFKKYLFDALSHFDLKEPILKTNNHLPGFTKIKKSFQWLDDTTYLSIIVPIIEHCKNPIRFDHYNLVRLATNSQAEINFAKDFLQSKTVKEEGKWELGRKTFLPNQHRIELDITYDCNLKCIHCNRSCTQAPSQAQMTLEQIQDFVKESIQLNKKWEIINVLGGEPTLHPSFEAIIHCLLDEYVIPFSANTTLQITSNGYGDLVQEKLNALPKHPNLVVNTNSYKTGREIPYFTPFNLAPKDQATTHRNEYHKGCWVTAYCGIGLNHLGYFACGVAGGIERIAQTGNAIQSLSLLDEKILQKQLEHACSLCGNFTDYAVNRGDFMERAEKDNSPKSAMSESWKKLYKAYKHEQ